MKKQTRFAAFSLWLIEFWGEPSPWAVARFVILVVLGVVGMAFLLYSDPMHSRGLGPGWECDRLKGGGVCLKDVKVPQPAPKQMK